MRGRITHEFRVQRRVFHEDDDELKPVEKVEFTLLGNDLVHRSGADVRAQFVRNNEKLRQAIADDAENSAWRDLLELFRRTTEHERKWAHLRPNADLDQLEAFVRDMKTWEINGALWRSVRPELLELIRELRARRASQ